MAKEFYARFPPETEALIEKLAALWDVPFAEVIRHFIERGFEGERRDREVRERVAHIMGRRDGS